MADVTQIISAIPLLRLAATVNPSVQGDKDDFVNKFEANNTHITNITVGELNTFGDQVNVVKDEMNTSAGNATTAATNSQLKAWESEAKSLTAQSYATEPEDVFVKIVTSDGDGNFTYTDTTDYSALHSEIKAAALVSSIPAGSINDAITTTTDANSSQFISDQLALKANKANPSFTGSITEETTIATNLIDASIGTFQYKELTQNETYTDGLNNGESCSITFLTNGFIPILPIHNNIDVVWLTDVPTIGSRNKFAFEKLENVLYVADAGKVS